MIQFPHFAVSIAYLSVRVCSNNIKNNIVAYELISFDLHLNAKSCYYFANMNNPNSPKNNQNPLRYSLGKT